MSTGATKDVFAPDLRRYAGGAALQPGVGDVRPQPYLGAGLRRALQQQAIHRTAVDDPVRLAQRDAGLRAAGVHMHLRHFVDDGCGGAEAQHALQLARDDERARRLPHLGSALEDHHLRAGARQAFRRKQAGGRAADDHGVAALLADSVHAIIPLSASCFMLVL
jgi:hypothetical protein